MVEHLNDGASVARSNIEAKIASIWAEVLGEAVEDHSTNFFDIGGSSLKMMRVHGALTRALARQIPIVVLFDHPSIASLSQHLAQQVAQDSVESASLPAASGGAKSGPRRVSFPFRKSGGDAS
jgi:acyl carrier protein